VRGSEATEREPENIPSVPGLKLRFETLDKVQESVAATRTLTNKFFYNHLLAINSMPFDGNLVDCPTVSQNILSGVLYRVKTSGILRRSNKEVDIVVHGRSQFVI